MEEDNTVSFYVWRVMFLGVSDAVFIFTALLKPVRSYTASLGVPNLMYLDDNLTGGATKEIACSNNEISNDVLKKAGWIVSMEKKKGPAQRILFLGLEVCSITMKFFIPEKKLIRLLALFDSLLSSKKVQLRKLASCLGLLQSCGKAIGPVVRLMTRRAYIFLMHNVDRHCWNFYMALSKDVIEDILFWQKNLVDLNGFKFSASLSMIDIHHEVIADASNIGLFGFAFFSSRYEIIFRRMLTAREVKKSSTHRELLAIHEIYTGVKAQQFANSTVRHLCDNKAVSEIMDHGSSVPELQALAVSIFLSCRRLNITLYVEWRRRDDPLSG